jgi:hypothetical protein
MNASGSSLTPKAIEYPVGGAGSYLSFSVGMIADHKEVRSESVRCDVHCIPCEDPIEAIDVTPHTGSNAEVEVVLKSERSCYIECSLSTNIWVSKTVEGD